MVGQYRSLQSVGDGTWNVTCLHVFSGAWFSQVQPAWVSDDGRSTWCGRSVIMSTGRHYRRLAGLHRRRRRQEPLILLPLLLLSRSNDRNELEVCAWTGAVATLPTPHQSVTDKNTAFTQFFTHRQQQQQTGKNLPIGFCFNCSVIQWLSLNSDVCLEMCSFFSLFLLCILPHQLIQLMVSSWMFCILMVHIVMTQTLYNKTNCQ